MKICIIDYGSGNLHSAKKAFERAATELGVDAGINAEILLTANPEDLKTADKIVLPGVGAFGDCYKGLASINGMIAELETQVLKNKKHFLGICVGMQLLAETGLENGSYKGLGWIKNSVVKKIDPKKIDPADNSLKIPHMGWNNLNAKTGAQNHKIFANIKDNSDVYFVHSYAMTCPDEYIIATTNYGGEVTAIIAHENIMGFQFHPEKSQNVGIQLIKNFITL
jgi:glutamine amidotransferase